MNDIPSPISPVDAPLILGMASECLADRATARDVGSERSMGRCVRSFNELTGHTLTEEQGWVFMAVLKMARAQGGSPLLDDYVDGAAYVALAGESALSGDRPPH